MQASTYYAETFGNPADFGSASIFDLEPSSAYDFFKRALDILGAGVGIALLMPLLPVLALLIKLDSRGPVFFSQERVGEAGERFKCWKFRTMYKDAEARKQALMEKNEMTCGVLFKMKDDPRITRIGKFLRKSSIDELPQLFNVLRGEMSLVGPRPALPSEVAKYSSSERGRLAVKPGITCLWQISGRGDLPFYQQVALDLDYARTRSLWLDFKILLMTLPAVVSGRGAY